MLAIALPLHPATAARDDSRELQIESHEDAAALGGRVQALVDHPLPEVVEALTRPAAWCEILILHLNVKYCEVDASGSGSTLRVGLGRKYFQSLDDVHWIEFHHMVIAATDDDLRVVLEAGAGPFGTHAYRIELGASPTGETRTTLRFVYAFRYGAAGRLAMRAYLASGGSEKVGFTVLEGPTGAASLVRGLRGAVERNIMRYFLAVEAHLAAQAAPAAERYERSLSLWFAATEVHSRQLHEMDLDDYLAMKRREITRQLTSAPALVAKD